MHVGRAAGGGRRDKGVIGMARLPFDDGAMTFPEEDLPDLARDAHEVVQEATDAGVWVFGGGLEHQVPSIVATDGTVTDGPLPGDQGGHRRVRDHRRALT